MVASTEKKEKNTYIQKCTINGIAEFAGLEFAGVENDGRSRRGGICRTGK